MTPKLFLFFATGGGGSGLGLFISKKIVDAHEGDISVFSSGQGHGCTFTIDIPALINEKSILQRTQTYGLTSDLHVRSRHLTSRDDMTEIEKFVQSSSTISTDHAPYVPAFHFLIVDDSPISRKMIIKYIRSLGYVCDFDEAETGIEAVQKVEKVLLDSLECQTCYDAIFMDNVMPQMDGSTAVRKIRELGYLGAIYGITGNALDSDVQSFLKSGLDEVFTKPIDAKGLTRAIGALRAPRSPSRFGVSVTG